jgi:hypothetical protein
MALEFGRIGFTIWHRSNMRRHSHWSVAVRLILTRSLDAGSGVVTITARSETAGKHAFALSQTAVPPSSPGLPANAWEFETPGLANVEATLIQQAVASSFPIGLAITAAEDGTVTISSHTRRYSDGHADVAVTGATIASGLAAGDFRAIAYDDPDRLGGAVAYSLYADDIDARGSPDHPGRHYVGYAYIPTAGSPPSSGGGASPPGGNCVVLDTPLMLADGETKHAGDIVIGDRMWTRHEVTLAWGLYPVEAITVADSDDIWDAVIGGRTLRATGDHLVYTGTWTKMRDLGVAVPGTFAVAKITVTGAHTYVSNGILSHNIKQQQNAE